MKKRAFSLVLAVVMLCSIFPLTASAESADSASLELSYTVEPPAEPEPQTEPDPSPSEFNPLAGTYVVNIPSSVGLNYEHDIVFTTQSNYIADNERLVVSIDAARTFEYPEGLFYLYYSEGDTTYSRMECVLKRGSSSDFSTRPSEVLTGPDDAVVATFKNNYNGADTYGWLAFEPIVTKDNVPGTYTGTIYFKINVVSE